MVRLCYFIKKANNYFKINKYTNLEIDFDKLEKKLKNILFYNCRRNINSELGVIKNTKAIHTENIIYKRQKLFTKSKKFLGEIQNKNYHTQILLIIKLSHIFKSVTNKLFILKFNS